MAQPSFRPQFTIFDAKKLVIYGKRWDESKRDAPAFRTKMYDNNPRFALRLNNNKFNDNITIALNPRIFFQIMDTIREVANDVTNEVTRFSWEIKSYRNHRREQYDKPTVVSKVYVGRDKEGSVYIALHPVGEDLAKFPFGSDFYAIMIGADGEPLSAAVGSNIAARAYANLSEQMVSHYMVNNPAEPKEAPAAAGGGGNSYGARRQAPKAAEFTEDDIDF